MAQKTTREEYTLDWSQSKVFLVIRCLISLLLPSYHRDDKWMVTIFGAMVPSSEVNEQLTVDDLLSFVENQETALQDNSSCVGELDAYTWLTVA